MDENKMIPEVFQEISFALGCENVPKAIDYLIDLNKEIFGEYKVMMNKEDLDVLSDSVNSTRLKNNPMKLSRAEIYDLYSKIMVDYNG